MWFWILYRAKQDYKVWLGLKLPFEHWTMSDITWVGLVHCAKKNEMKMKIAQRWRRFNVRQWFILSTEKKKKKKKEKRKRENINKGDQWCFVFVILVYWYLAIIKHKIAHGNSQEVKSSATHTIKTIMTSKMLLETN